MSDDDLTDSERRFLIEYGGLTAAELTPEALAEAASVAEHAIAASIAEVRAGALTVSEVASLLGQPRAEVLQAAASGDLYAVLGEPPAPEPLFPGWQFQEGRVVPHLREVIAALPADEHPLLVQSFMTSWDEDHLDGWPPAAWLLAGRDPGAVVQYADELSWL
ncbi:hypothetical protein [Microbacterium sp. OVT16B]|uniref:hypothetical protein n=1 Tax=Microbacterium sp. OVT16B TaxID=2862682 RepID=UPI001CBF3203|nr:hypothetical protein [Microbacterium sp. OVT16B]